MFGGLTSICQPLDIAINKPFKDNLRKEWHIWMADGGAGETAKGNLRRARFSDVCSWVKKSWERIPDEIIIESFKTCEISIDFDSDLEILDKIISIVAMTSIVATILMMISKMISKTISAIMFNVICILKH